MPFSSPRRMTWLLASILLGMSAALHAQTSDITLTPDFAGDDPAAIRDTLAKHVPVGGATTPREIARIRQLIGSVLHRDSANPALSGSGLDRNLAFVLPADHGLHYRNKSHVMLVDVSLSDDDDPTAISLKRTVKGPRGRHLVVAAEAKEKGFIQTVDQIELDASGEKGHLNAQGHFVLPREAYEQSSGHVAIVLICRLVPPFLSETKEHSDPSDEEPTDITTRTSTLHAEVEDVWVIDQAHGTLLAKGLHLSR